MAEEELGKRIQQIHDEVEKAITDEKLEAGLREVEKAYADNQAERYHRAFTEQFGDPDPRGK